MSANSRQTDAPLAGISCVKLQRSCWGRSLAQDLRLDMFFFASTQAPQQIIAQ